MTAKEYLSQYRTLDAEINSKLEQAAQLRALAAKVSPSTGFGSSGGISDRVGKTVAKIVDLENEINEKIDNLIDLKKEIDTRIAAIANPAYRIILENYYILGKSFEEIGEMLNYSRMQICRNHGTALTFISIPEKDVTNVIECYKKI